MGLWFYQGIVRFVELFNNKWRLVVYLTLIINKKPAYLF